MDGFIVPGQRQPSALEIETSGDAYRRDVLLRGDLDVCTVGELRIALLDCAALGTRLVVIDLAELDFLAVAGLNLFQEAHEMLSGAGARLVLARVQPSALRILQLVGLDTILSVEIDSERPRPAFLPICRAATASSAACGTVSSAASSPVARTRHGGHPEVAPHCQRVWD